MKKTSTGDILSELYDVVRDRCDNPPPTSYVADLVRSGPEKICAKIMEEAAELVAAAAENNRDAIVHEAADLWFHAVVLLGVHRIHPGTVLDVLHSRRGVSGITEKKQRGSHGASS